MRKRLNLRFEPQILRGIMKAFDDTGDGDINFRKFTFLVMGSTQQSSSSLAIGRSEFSADAVRTQEIYQSPACIYSLH